MNTKDEPGKGPAGQPGTGNRPHATLDLKATVVKPAREEEDAPAREPSASTASASGSRGAPGTTSASPGTDAEPRPRNTTASPARTTGYGGFFTHLAAGVAGGIFALLVADMLASQLGLGERSSAIDLSPLEQRLSSLETAGKSSVDGAALATRLKAAEGRIAKLQTLAANVDMLTQNQAELSGDVKSIDAKLGAQGADSMSARVGKLEQQLAAMSTAAETDPASGRLPQLAALTGKIADLETMLPAKLDALRKSVADEIETRVAVATDASEAAKSTTQRLDRDVSTMKNEYARTLADLTALKSETDRASAALRSTADSLLGLRTEIEARLATFAKSSDVAAAVAPVSTQLGSLQNDVRGVIDSEEARKTTAQRIVLSLDLADLKRVIERGGPYASELDHVRDVAQGSVDLAPLNRYADKGVPTLAELRAEFKPLAYKLIDTQEEPSDGSIMGRLLSGAKSVVRVRKINHSADDKTVEAIISRIEAALSEDRLGDVLEEARTLPPPAQDAARDFLTKVEARSAVDKALQTVEVQLKSSLVAPVAPVPPAGPVPPSAGAAQR